MATDSKQGLEAALRDVNDLIAITLKQIASTENSSLFTAAEKAPRLAALRAELAGYQAQQTALTQQLNQLNLLENQRNTASSADTTAQAQAARDDGANPGATTVQQKVETPDGRIVAATTAGPTNAVPAATTANGNVDAGTNTETVTLTNSQAIASPPASGAIAAPPSTPFQDPQQRAQFNQLQSSGAVAGATPTNSGTQAGAGARGDDAAQPITNSTRNRLDELYGGAANSIIPQANILDRYASYTYSLSWYLVDPATYNQMVKSSKRNLNGYYLLVQSGGAPINNQVPTQVVDPQQAAQNQDTVGYGRSPYFPLDYYIDDLEFNITYGGSPVAGGAATFSDLSFTVTEPNGITLLDNLYRAVADLYTKKNLVKPGTAPNYSAAMYVIAIRFYGYDIDGNLVQPIAQRLGTTDNQAAVEKFIPFIISSIDFKVSNKLVAYQVKGTVPGTATGFSTNRGSIPQNFQFQGTTVKDILVGSVVQQTASEAAGDQVRNGVPIANSPPASSAASANDGNAGEGEAAAANSLNNFYG